MPMRIATGTTDKHRVGEETWRVSILGCKQISRVIGTGGARMTPSNFAVGCVAGQCLAGLRTAVAEPSKRCGVGTI